MNNFDEIYRCCAKPLYGYVLKLSRNETVAEEIVQQTFYKAVKSVRKFKGECRILTWLCRIAKNEYLNYIKKRENSHLNIDDFNTLSDACEIEKIVEDKDAAAAAISALNSLSEPYRGVFELRILDDLSYGEIADIFGKSENWSRVTFYRAKQKIIEKMEEQGYEV